MDCLSYAPAVHKKSEGSKASTEDAHTISPSLDKERRFKFVARQFQPVQMVGITRDEISRSFWQRRLRRWLEALAFSPSEFLSVGVEQEGIAFGSFAAKGISDFYAV